MTRMAERALVCAHDGPLEAGPLHVLTEYIPNGEHLPVERSLVIEVEIGLVLEYQRSVALREEHLPDAEHLDRLPGDGPLWATQTVGTPSRQVPCGGPLAIGRPSHALSELPLSFADRFVDAPWFRDQVEGRTSVAAHSGPAWGYERSPRRP